MQVSSISFLYFFILASNTSCRISARGHNEQFQKKIDEIPNSEEFHETVDTLIDIQNKKLEKYINALQSVRNIKGRNAEQVLTQKIKELNDLIVMIGADQQQTALKKK